MDTNELAKGIVKTSVTYMTISALLGIILGIVMLFYPGGTMALMEAALMIFQVIITVFIVYYTVTEAVFYFRMASPVKGVLYLVIGIVATVFVWLFNVNVLFYVIAAFLVLTGIADIAGGFKLDRARYFLILLGIFNILIALIILRHPMVLPILIAWYILFWGISRLLLSFELRKLLK